MSGIYQAYPEYKKSGVEWIGAYPDEWNLTRVKFESYVKARVGWHGLKSDDFTDEGPYLVTGSDFKGPEIDWKECYHCDLERYEQDPYIQLKDGDLLITKDGTIGKVALVNNLDQKATLNSGVFVVRPLENNYSSQFYFWLLQSSVFTGFVDFNKTGSTIVHLYQDTFVNFQYAMPSFSEQEKIVNFLELETAKIDTLIDKQQQFIKLLREKRQAVISHAVTKGLNPKAPMRDSGVEWLGEVPEHWVVKRVKHFGKIIGGYAFKSGDFVDSGIRAVKIANVSHLSFDWSDSSYLPRSFLDEQKSYIPTKGSLIFAMTRPIISGGVKVAKFDLDEECLVNQRVGFLKPSSEINQDYLMYVAQSKSFFCAFENNCTVTNQPNISAEGIEDIRFTCPELDEQQEVVNYIERVSSLIEDTVKKGMSQVELLKERRRALISSAVSGGIDVRNWQPPEPSNNKNNKEVAA